MGPVATMLDRTALEDWLHILIQWGAFEDNNARMYARRSELSGLG